jgi:hypothetical protein
MTDKNQDLEIMGAADEQMLRDFFEGFKEDILTTVFPIR